MIKLKRIEKLKELIETRIKEKDGQRDNLLDTISKLEIRPNSVSISGMSQCLITADIQLEGLTQSIISLNEILKTVEFILQELEE